MRSNAPKTKTVFTGEYRTPLKERLQRINVQSIGTGTQKEELIRPQTPPPRHDRECPGAPRKDPTRRIRQEEDFVVVELYLDKKKKKAGRDVDVDSKNKKRLTGESGESPLRQSWSAEMFESRLLFKSSSGRKNM